MKTLLIALFFFSAFLSAQNDSILGNVKSVRERIIFMDSIQKKELLELGEEYGHFGFSKPELELSQMRIVWYNTASPGYANYIRNFNEEGQLISEEWFDMRDSIMYGFKYEYDKMGNLIQSLESYRGKEYSTINNYKYIFDGLLRTKVRVYKDSPEYYFYSIYYYDENKNLIQIRNFDEYGEQMGAKYEYDEQGRISKQYKHPNYIYVKEGKSWVTKIDNSDIDYLEKINIYDEFSNLVQEKLFGRVEDYSNEYKQTGTMIYSYNDKGQMIKSCLQSNSISMPQPLCKLYRYDENKLLKEKDEPEEKALYEYIDGYISEIKYERKIFDKWKKSKVNFQYEFDSQKNWTKQTKIVNGVPLYVRMREIEYF
ncbi:hypothetical protein [Moheibacter sp.]|uniref:hypothetical protein n=1 Tax=Moheibacter sp. TaxID=1965316 RepID=UPI003C7737D8